MSIITIPYVKVVLSQFIFFHFFFLKCQEHWVSAILHNVDNNLQMSTQLFLYEPVIELPKKLWRLLVICSLVIK